MVGYFSAAESSTNLESEFLLSMSAAAAEANKAKEDMRLYTTRFEAALRSNQEVSRLLLRGEATQTIGKHTYFDGSALKGFSY